MAAMLEPSVKCSGHNKRKLSRKNATLPCRRTERQKEGLFFFFFSFRISRGNDLPSETKIELVNWLRRSWSEGEVGKLVELCEERSCLWNVKDCEYQNRQTPTR